MPCLFALFVLFWVCCNEGSLCACQAALNSLVPQGKQIPVVPLTIPALDSFHSQEHGAQKCCRGMPLVSPAIPVPLPFS